MDFVAADGNVLIVSDLVYAAGTPFPRMVPTQRYKGLPLSLGGPLLLFAQPAPLKVAIASSRVTHISGGKSA
jgi:hypothetical protein